MNPLKYLIVATLGLHMTQVFAVPRQLITHNDTNVESNAYVAGTIPSRFPSKPHSVTSVAWTEVRMACFGHTVNNKCSAVVRMETGKEDGGHPIDLGTVTVDLNTGMITPSRLSAHGYTLVVNGPAETTITQDK